MLAGMPARAIGALPDGGNPCIGSRSITGVAATPRLWGVQRNRPIRRGMKYLAMHNPPNCSGPLGAGQRMAEFSGVPAGSGFRGGAGGGAAASVVSSGLRAGASCHRAGGTVLGCSVSAR